ncbi:MAG: hypothetical protein ABIA37_02200 [Candidatus Woesearchaeota archaeon]
MSKHDTGPIVIRYTGLFDMDGVYSAMVDWCKNYGFIWQEGTYKHKVPTPKGAEQEFEWTAEREVTDYIKNTIFIKGHLWDATEVDIEVNGKRKTLTNGRMEMVITGSLITDWQGTWKGGKFIQWLGKAYENYILKKDIESIYWDEMYYRLWNFHAVLKKYFDLQAKWHEYKNYLGE